MTSPAKTRSDLLSYNEVPHNRHPITLREYLLIAVTITALILPSIFRPPPQSKISLTDRINTPVPIINTTPCEISDDIATFIISCGNNETDAVMEMQPLLKSIILLTSIPLRFIFITDEDGDDRIRKMFTDLGRTQRKIIIETTILSEAWMNEWALQTRMDIYSHHSGRFGMAKFAAPWLLPNISTAVVLDTDMIMLKDPAMLWQEALREEGDGFQTGWVYRMMLSAGMERASQICSCVVAMRLQKAREENVYPDKVRKLFEANPQWKRFPSRLFRTTFGDQSVYFGLWQQEHRLVGALDSMWNRDHCHNFHGVFSTREKSVGMLHRNCYHDSSPKKNQTNDLSPPFFNFYVAYRWHWLRAPDGHGCDVEVVGGE